MGKPGFMHVRIAQAYLGRHYETKWPALCKMGFMPYATSVAPAWLAHPLMPPCVCISKLYEFLPRPRLCYVRTRSMSQHSCIHSYTVLDSRTFERSTVANLLIGYNWVSVYILSFTILLNVMRLIKIYKHHYLITNIKLCTEFQWLNLSCWLFGNFFFNFLKKNWRKFSSLEGQLSHDFCQEKNCISKKNSKMFFSSVVKQCRL